MLKGLEPQLDHHNELIEYCQTLGIEFLSTAADST